MKTTLVRLSQLALLAAGIDSAMAQPPQVSAANNPMEVDPAEYLDRIELPEGFSISIYASGLEAARSMALADDGTLYVGSLGPLGGPAVGKVYAVTDKNRDGRADEVLTILEGLNFPNGVALRDGSLYVAELNRILRYDQVATRLHDMPAPVVVNDSFPDDYMHGWKFINFGPDGKLYVPVGGPCNTCESEKEIYATINRMNADGSGLEIFARGVRNSVGFDWHPVTGELWFTDNGRDLWGDTTPPEELNHAPVAGLHFGFPYRYGKTLVDSDYSTSLSASDFTPAALEIPAHNAGLGIEFYTGSSFPAQYRNQLFAAYHGSWNRNPPDGYKIRLMRFENNQAVGFEDFASGWMIDDKYWGRPVDIELMPDGSMLVSDDFNGVIYRIAYGK
ncbi:MAG: PQQ-dependent sugar dehydrogenase [Pseudomonadales bacterium]|nr:PQQ-dependent sugar dehydrogenase [Pseudomonadales bacterium]